MLSPTPLNFFFVSFLKNFVSMFHIGCMATSV